MTIGPCRACGRLDALRAGLCIGCERFAADAFRYCSQCGLQHALAPCRDPRYAPRSFCRRCGCFGAHQCRQVGAVA